MNESIHQVIPVRLECPWKTRNLRLDAKKLSTSEKTWLAHEVLYYGCRGVDLATKYGIKPGTLRKWVFMIRQGRAPMGKKGRPALFDEEYSNNLLRELRSEKYQTRSDECDNLYVEAAMKTARKRNQSFVEPHRSSLWRYEKKNKIHGATAGGHVMNGKDGSNSIGIPATTLSLPTNKHQQQVTDCCSGDPKAVSHENGSRMTPCWRVRVASPQGSC